MSIGSGDTVRSSEHPIISKQERTIMNEQEEAKDLMQKIELCKKAGLHKEADKLEKLFKDKYKALLPVGSNKTPSLEAEKVLRTLLTQDPRMIEAKDNIRKLVLQDDTVLIIGESGTGKEILARALHGDRPGAFIAINCAGMPAELFESEMYGHVRGAFSGADSDKIGLMEAAKDGTLFLDEVGDMPLTLQAKLLRSLQQKSFRAVGGIVEKQLFCRVVAATHHNLEELVNANKFRLDLYARLSVFPIITIPLRHRMGDVKLIVDKLDSTHTCYEKNKEIFEDATKYPLNVRNIQSRVRQWEVLGKIL